jgi:hypothetical protein
MRTLRQSLGVAAPMVVIGGLAVVSTLALGSESSPTASAEPAPVRLVPGSERVAPAQRLDGGNWSVRQFRSDTGQICLQFGELRQGRLGRSTRGGFAEEPASEGGVCGDPAGPFLSVTREPDNPHTRKVEAAKTAVFGVLPGAARDVLLRSAGRSIELDKDSQGVFFVLLDGIEAGRGPLLTWTQAGREHTLGGGLVVDQRGRRLER